MNEFFSWELLATFAGASAATGLIVQVLKNGIKIPTQLLSYIVAAVILLAATLATGGAEGWQGWAIVPINALVVSLAANGGFDVVKRVAVKKENE